VSTAHGSPGWHQCHLCADGFSTGRQLERHVEARHFGKTETSQRYVCRLCAASTTSAAGVTTVSYAVQGLLTKHLQNAHGVPRVSAAKMAKAAAPTITTSDCASDADRLDDSSAEVKPVRRLFVCGESSVYQCSRCDFSASERPVFVRHAGEHGRAVAGAVQCYECAASFTVPVALGRHLRVIHRIDSDVDTYLRDSAGGGAVSRCATPQSSATDDEPSPTEPSSNETSRLSSAGRSSTDSTTSASTPASLVKPADDDDDAPAECTVCYRVLLTKHLLRAHMRTHGIAFIQHTRRRLSAATSPAARSSPA